MSLHVSSTCACHQEVKIALHSLWYHHTYRWPSGAQVERGLSQPVHETATYWCDDTRGCVTQFWPPDDEYMCSKHIQGTGWERTLSTCARDGNILVWWYQRLCNAILTSWWRAHVLETYTGHRLREDSLNLCTRWLPIGVMIPEAV